MDIQTRSDLTQETWLTEWEKDVVVRTMLTFDLLKWGKLPLKKGGTTDIYVNLRQARNSPEAMRYFAQVLENPIRRLGADRIAEIPQAVTCFSGLLAAAIGLPLVTIRDQPKTGRVSAADIIGQIHHDELVALYDDVITDGRSKLPGYWAIRNRGAYPVQVVLVDRQQGWQQTFAAENIDMPVWAGMTLHDIRYRLIKWGLMERCSSEAEQNNPLILALDGRSWEELLPLLEQLRRSGTILKVNDLVIGMGVDTLLPRLQTYGRVMVDIKTHDVPTTVRNTCGRVSKHQPWAVTLHASGGSVAIETAVGAFVDTSTIPLFVTLLTSIKDESETIYRRRPLSQVRVLAKLAWEQGARGFVCSPLEVKTLRGMFPEATLVTPGVRSEGADRGTQERVSTPSDALGNGADYIVGGSQFFGAPDPLAEIKRVLANELGREITF